MADVGLHAVRNVDSPLYYTDFVSFVLRRIFHSKLYFILLTSFELLAILFHRSLPQQLPLA